MTADDIPQALLLYRSNRVERLVQALADVVRKPRADPLAPELVAVHSAEMGRWLSLRLAQELGICANVRFEFPGRLLQGLLATAPDAPPAEDSGWDRDRLAWSVLRVLPELLPRPELAPLRQYLQGAGGPGHEDRRQVQLALRIAQTLDRYITYRPQMVRAWDRGQPGDADREDWQPLLWQALRRVIPGPHLVQSAQTFLEALGRNEVPADALPERLCLFAVATLPPLYLDLFGRLARRLPVHLFLLSPSDAYWGDICSKRERARLLRDAPRSELDESDLHLSHGAPLLATFGKLGRDFQVVLEGRDAELPYVEPRADLFEDPGQDSRLHNLQRDVLNLVYRRPGAADPPLPPPPPGDRSLSVHACHGAIRQVEVLRDELLAAFSADPGLEPRDVVVMTPDLEAHAPLIEALFADGDAAAAPGDAGFPALPYRLADRSLRGESPAAEGLLRLLELASGRATASAVLDLLTVEPVRRRFGLEHEDLPQLQQWLEQSGIRWGLDSEDRRHHGQPPYHENTWRFGLDRLLLGHAVGEGQAPRLFRGVLPHEGVEGDRALLLGRFVDFCETLLAQLQDLDSPRSMTAWRDRLYRLLEQLLAGAGEEASWLLLQLREALAALTRQADQAGFQGELSLAAVQGLLEDSLARSQPGGRFASGAITVCAMVPLRAIPFRVVCLLGLDEGAFPRQQTEPGFDLLAAEPRVGDRNGREDDRYLLLEALLSARDRLIITYEGRGVRDNKPRPPAVPVGELLDVVRDSFQPPPGAPDAATALVQQHPLQAFSPRCYDDPASASFDRRYLQAARTLQGPRAPAPPFLDGPLPAPADPQAGLTVDLADLERFFGGGPCGYFFNRRLGVWPEQQQSALPDREPAEPDLLERYQLGDSLLAWALEPDPRPDPRELLRAGGQLPLGVPGQLLHQELQSAVEALAEQVRQARTPPARQPLALDLELSGVKLEGRLGQLWTAGQVRHQYARVGAKHELELWIRHLALTLADPAFAGHSVLFGRAPEGPSLARVELGPQDPTAAAGQLTLLLQLFLEGQRQPLLFFPQTSRAFEQARQRDPGDPGAWSRAARAAWDPDKFPYPGEGAAPAARRLLGEAEPFGDDLQGSTGLATAPGRSFEALASAIWGPLLAALQAGPGDGGAP